MPFLVLAALLLAAAAYLVSEVVTQPEPRTPHRGPAGCHLWPRPLRRCGPRSPSLPPAGAAPATASLAGFALRLNPRVTHENISLRLMAAGMGRSRRRCSCRQERRGGIAGFVVGFAHHGFRRYRRWASCSRSVSPPRSASSSRLRRRRAVLVRAAMSCGPSCGRARSAGGLRRAGCCAFEARLPSSATWRRALAEEFSHTLGEMGMASRATTRSRSSPTVPARPEVSLHAQRSSRPTSSVSRLAAPPRPGSGDAPQASGSPRRKAVKSPIKMLFRP